MASTWNTQNGVNLTCTALELARQGNLAVDGVRPSMACRHVLNLLTKLGVQSWLSAQGLDWGSGSERPRDLELSADTVVGLIAASAAKVAIEKRLDRVKICPADDRRLAFDDTSRNRSRHWCSMEVCGSRAKARAHRERSAPA